jgi:hypothetical protein
MVGGTNWDAQMVGGTKWDAGGHQNLGGTNCGGANCGGANCGGANCGGANCGVKWSLVNYGYSLQLAIAWTTTTRTHWTEQPANRVLEESLFWVQTRTVGCDLLYGTLQMLLEVAGHDKAAIAKRTQLLAESDWSAFPEQEQSAYAFARKLSAEPWNMTAEDDHRLEADYGNHQAMSIFW